MEGPSLKPPNKVKLISQVAVNHPDPKTLADFALGLASEEEAESIANHIAGCESCATAVNNTPLDKVIGLVQAMRDNVIAAPAQDPEAALAASQEVVQVPNFLPMPRSLRNQTKYRVVEMLGARAAWAWSTKRNIA